MSLGMLIGLLLVGAGALAAGILIGRYYVPDDRVLKRSARHARMYARALSQVLDGDDEAAIAALRAVVEDSTEELEPYFALAALFRRQGDWERAIRVHQGISVRAGQDRDTRVRVLYQLGLDCQRAGMPRWAISALEECVRLGSKDDDKHEDALLALVGLYQRQGRYARSAEALQRLCKVRGTEAPPELHCLLSAAADSAMRSGDLESARQLVRDAQKLDDRSAYGRSCAAELAAAQGQHEAAIRHLEQALAVQPELARVLVPGLVAAHGRLLESDPEANQHERLVAAVPAQAAEAAADPAQAAEAAQLAPPGDALAACAAVGSLDQVQAQIGRNGHLELAAAELVARYDAEASLARYHRAAEAYPALLPARVAAARLALGHGDADDVRRELEALVEPGGVLAWALEGSWRCSHCGYRAPSLFWLCTACRRWGTVRLDIGREALEVPRPASGAVHAALAPAQARPLLGPSGHNALPAPALASGLSDEDRLAESRRPSMLGRMSSWFSGAWAGVRGSRGSVPPPAAPRAALPDHDPNQDADATTKLPST